LLECVLSSLYFLHLTLHDIESVLFSLKLLIGIFFYLFTGLRIDKELLRHLLVFIDLFLKLVLLRVEALEILLAFLDVLVKLAKVACRALDSGLVSGQETLSLKDFSMTQIEILLGSGVLTATNSHDIRLLFVKILL
jgi:hypothetical protein